MSKYYTPKLEEFHIGFRYQLFDADRGVWGDVIFKDGEYVENIVEEGYGEVRVKYLDREDIEELGWSNHKKAVDDWYELIPEEPIQPFSLKYQALRLTHGDDRRVRIIGYESPNFRGEEVLFCGEAKNYNELKRLMEQLKIIK